MKNACFIKKYLKIPALWATRAFIQWEFFRNGGSINPLAYEQFFITLSPHELQTQDVKWFNDLKLRNESLYYVSSYFNDIRWTEINKWDLFLLFPTSCYYSHNFVYFAQQNSTGWSNIVECENQVRNLYQRFKSDYNKGYRDEKEDEDRLNIFSKNLAKVNKHNNDAQHSWKMGMNKYMDMTGKGCSRHAKYS